MRIDRRTLIVYVGLTVLIWPLALAAGAWLFVDGPRDQTDILLLVFMLAPLLPGLLVAEILALVRGRTVSGAITGWRGHLRIYATHILIPISLAYVIGIVIASLFDRRLEHFSFIDLMASHVILLALPLAAFCAAGLILLPLIRLGGESASSAQRPAARHHG